MTAGPTALRSRGQSRSGGGSQQVPRLAEFPVGIGGVGELHAVFSYGKPHTRLCLGAAWQIPRLRSEAVTFLIFSASSPTLNQFVLLLLSVHPVERLLIEVAALPFVIPSAAEGPAVRPGSRSKVWVSLVLTHTL